MARVRVVNPQWVLRQREFFLEFYCAGHLWLKKKSFSILGALLKSACQLDFDSGDVRGAASSACRCENMTRFSARLLGACSQATRGFDLSSAVTSARKFDRFAWSVNFSR